MILIFLIGVVLVVIAGVSVACKLSKSGVDVDLGDLKKVRKAYKTGRNVHQVGGWLKSEEGGR